MRTVKQFGGWNIKEKETKEIPIHTNINRRYSVFSSDGVFVQDNLLFTEAIEWCKKHDKRTW